MPASRRSKLLTLGLCSKDLHLSLTSWWSLPLWGQHPTRPPCEVVSCQNFSTGSCKDGEFFFLLHFQSLFTLQLLLPWRCLFVQIELSLSLQVIFFFNWLTDCTIGSSPLPTTLPTATSLNLRDKWLGLCISRTAQSPPLPLRTWEHLTFSKQQVDSIFNLEQKPQGKKANKCLHK